MDVLSVKDSIYVFILDNDESIDSNNKYSIVKTYELTNQTKYISEWNS